MAQKIFPSTNNIGGGKTGDESTMANWLKSLISNNFVVSGFDVDSTSGLDVVFNAGEAVIEGYAVIEDAQTTLTMTDNETNYVYYQLEYDGLGNVVDTSGFVVNTTGVQPSNSIHLNTVLASLGTVTTNANILSGNPVVWRNDYKAEVGEFIIDDYAQGYSEGAGAESIITLKAGFKGSVRIEAQISSDGATASTEVKKNGSRILYFSTSGNYSEEVDIEINQEDTITWVRTANDSSTSRRFYLYFKVASALTTRQI